MRVSPEVLGKIKDELVAIAPLAHISGRHEGSWTNPYGSVRPFSLFNNTGGIEDGSNDFNPFLQDKRFQVELPTLTDFYSQIPDLLNLRLNCIGPGSGLSEHEEEVFLAGEKRLRLRFHLPVITNPGARISLDGETFHFMEGNIYFFNNGCVHGAWNEGGTDRYHLVWDVILTNKSYEFFFGDVPLGRDLLRLPVNERRVSSNGVRHTPGFNTARSYSNFYQRLRLGCLGLSERNFQRAYNVVASWIVRLPGFVRI